MFNDNCLCIADGLERITLKRPGSDLKWEIGNALRRRSLRIEQSKTTISPMRWCHWILPVNEMSETPLKGDEIIDSRNHIWVVAEVEVSALTGTWKCVSQTPSCSFASNENVDLLRLVSDNYSEGETKHRWILLLVGVPAYLTPPIVKNDTATTHANPGASQQNEIRVIVVRSPLDICTSDRLRTKEGIVYRIEQIDFPDTAHGWIEIRVAKIQ